MENRVIKIKDALADNEAFLIRSNTGRFYISGFSSSAGIVFITKKHSYFLIDFRYFEKAKRDVSHLDVVLLENTFQQLNAICESEKVKTVYTECDRMTLSDFSLYGKNLNAKLSDDNKIGNLLSEMRQIKDRTEIENIKRAQQITDKTFSYILDRIAVGRTEKEIALDMEFYIRNLGSEGVSFDFIAVSGKNSSLPHGVPTEKKIEKGDLLTMDFGAVCCGYRSDMTRTVAVGFVSDEQRRVYETVLKAQEIALAGIKPGAVCKCIDKLARDYIDNSGYEGCFGHGLGHSVGIEIHENPSLSKRCETKLKSGMVLTVEPGIYIENKFGVRIEDMVVIDDVSFENITKSPKELIIL